MTLIVSLSLVQASHDQGNRRDYSAALAWNPVCWILELHVCLLGQRIIYSRSRMPISMLASSPTRDLDDLAIKDEKPYGFMDPTTRKADRFSANEWKLEISKSAIEPK